MIKEVIVVEGKDDTAAIKRAVQADTIETGGSAINQEILNRIRLAMERRGVIVFTDPDHAGEKIRKQVAQAVPGCKHAFLDREQAEARKGRGLGVEHATSEAIRAALKKVQTEHPGKDSEITKADLLEAGLIAHPDAAKRREQMGKILNIGYANGKQFFHRCQMFQISKEEFQRAAKQLNVKGQKVE